MPTLAEIDARLGLYKSKAAATPTPDLDKSRFKFTEVPAGDEFKRIFALPRRPIPDMQSADVQELAQFLTKRLSLPGVDLYPGPMFGHQAMILKEAWENKGAAGTIGVGKGKTLITALLPTVLQAPDALLLTMGDMARDATTEFAKLRKCWRMLPAHKFRIMNYQTIATPAAGELLADDGKTVLRKSLISRLRPSVLILDEAHAAAGGGTGTSRIEAYIAENPDCIVVVMSGTFFKTSIKDGQKLLQWALRERCPLPCDFAERELWSSVLDAKRPEGVRNGYGALKYLLNAQEEEQVRALEDEDDGAEERRSIYRRAVARRVLETPGVIGTQDPPLPVKLTVDYILPPGEDSAIAEAFRKLRGNETLELPGWQLPNDTWIPDGIQAARHGLNLGLGFFTEWEPPPPESYRFHSKHWNQWCHNKIQRNNRGIDSEARCADAVTRELPGFDDTWKLIEAKEACRGMPDGVAEQLVGLSRLRLWQASRADYTAATKLPEPPVVGRWIADEIVEVVREWLDDHNGVIWVNSIPLGQRLSAELGIPYYGDKGLNAQKQHITKHPPGTPAIASKKANGTGKNLQHIWFENLWLTAPDEQSLGRTHRQGQKAPAVHNWVYIGCYEHLKAFYGARNVKATFQEDMQLSPQKLQYAEVRMPTTWELVARAEGDRMSRWSPPTNNKKKDVAD